MRDPNDPLWWTWVYADGWWRRVSKTHYVVKSQNSQHVRTETLSWNDDQWKGWAQYAKGYPASDLFKLLYPQYFPDE